MSLQGPMIVVAENPATELVAALSAAGAFPIVEAKWADAPTAFVAVKPAAVVIAEPGSPRSESSSRMLCLQIATVNGPIVPIIAMAHGDMDAAIPIALSADASLPVARLIARLQSAMRVRALHATVLRRIELFASHGGKLPKLPVGDALDDATVLIAGRGPLYPALSVAMGERVKMVGALSVETAAKHLNARDIDGIVVGDGFSPRMVEAFLTVLAQDTRFRDIPVAVIGEAPAEFTEALPNIDHVDGDPARLVARMVPLVRMHAFEVRLKRMLKSLDANGMFDPETGLLTRDSFSRDLTKALSDASDRSLALSIARYSFDGPLDPRARLDGARLVTRLIRNIDFACRDEDGSILIAFTQTDLRSAHVVARRIAAALRNSMLVPHRGHDKITANVTLATLKNGDSLNSLMLRVMGSRMVAAE
ncbi:MAG: GGDEF domain-containing protein [Deltaproteobacteria bacterium]|nr:GGDEF domain-containing protein [Deltaproteobacteria bacterium]